MTGSRDTVLIIDKNHLTRFSLKTSLWKIGCNVYETDDSIEAITIMVKQSPGVVLFSLEFEKTKNMELVHKIKELQECLLIAYSDTVTRKDLVNCFNASVDEILVNPCSQTERLYEYFNNPVQEIRKTFVDQFRQLVHREAKRKNALPYRQALGI